MDDSNELVVLPTQADVAAAAAERFVQLAQAAIAEKGTFSVALAGGSTPKAMYQLLAAPPLRDQVPWEQVLFFWSDERFVAPDHEDSNYRVSRETLLDKIPLTAAHVFLTPTIGSTPEAAAESYSDTIAETIGEAMRFDLVLLGIGPDGHTASLFPGRPEVTAPPAPYVFAIHDSPKPPPTRLTFSLALINKAAHVLVLAPGAEKADAVRQCLQPAPGEAHLPAGMVQPTGGKLTWLVDASAAGKLADRE